MKNWKTLAGGVAFTAMTAAIVAPAYAQVTSAAIDGYVVSETGDAIVGATVTATDVRTGRTLSTTTGGDGRYTFRGLSVGGLYTVTANSDAHQGKTVEGIMLSLGDSSAVDFALMSDDERKLETVVVSASAAAVAPVAVGPSATFGAEVLQQAPAINRNITDVLRIDPRVFVDESRGDINAVQCGGKNSRFNSLTLDGVRMNDNFGLNANGYPTERIPFSYDAIEQVAIELAPFDVQYGGFSACNINAVTKSGGNEFEGYGFVDYTSDSLRGDTLEGDELTGGEYDEYRYGFGVGGPIVKDKLFFFASYEKLEGSNLFNRGAIGSGAVNEVDITQAEVDEIAAIAREIYGYDPGEIPSSADVEDEKLLLKLDWIINENHRAALTYNYNDGYNIAQSDGDPDELEFSNHLYERGAELNSYVGSIYSDWSDNFSTEFRLGYSELDNRQNSLGGTDFGEITIETDDVDVYIGGDDSRQANKLYYETLSFAAKGFYSAGAHNFTFGYEREQLDIFNMFVQHVETEIDFERIRFVDPDSGVDANGDGEISDYEYTQIGTMSAIDAFRGGWAENVDYNNAPSGNPEDAAADWGYTINSLYGQDEYDFGNGLTVVGGFRYDWYTTEDEPETNPDFLADYGFSNGQTLDGKGLIQPRLGFQWEKSEDLSLRGGVGLYSGGNPNVWLSNTYSANNVLQFGTGGRDAGLEIREDRVFWDPDTQTMEEALAAAVTSLLDPSVEYGLVEDGVPASAGYGVPQDLIDDVAAGAGSNFEINYLDPDFVIPREWKFSLGGTYYPEMAGVPGDYVFSADVMYTISQESAIWIRGDVVQDGTATGPDGREYPVYTSVREGSFVLANSPNDAHSFQISTSVAADYDFGLDWALGYAYTDAEDVHPMTSSVASSNYWSRAFADPQSTAAATSDYNTKHRFTLVSNYRRAFFGDNETILSLFGQASSGRPYSLVTDFSDGGVYLDGNDLYLANGAERNGEEGSWWGKLDVKLEQEFPGFADHKGSVFVVVDNFTNLLNDEWGVLREPGFPATCLVGDDCESRQGDASRYEIRFGARYEF